MRMGKLKDIRARGIIPGEGKGRGTRKQQQQRRYPNIQSKGELGAR